MSEAPTETLTPKANQDDHSKGPANAPVTVVEYGDYECPYCGEVEPWVKDLQHQLGNRLRFVFRNFPLPQHPYAEIAAEAAEAAGAQGKFWQMHDLLYQNQNALAAQDLVAYAQQLGLDIPTFVRAIENREYDARIQGDVMSGEESGVQGTPTFFINGREYEGPLQEQALLSAAEHAANS
ncbi:MAG: DsbA family protein [Chloroflexota bacterium]|nr:DsbA family protein [Chloroflexota bacterium]